ncbi:hypothetical protein BKA65DRAFT_549010 [Rhexocercosporidium sp. MPI-PUGE-AT-0058]|nr:hypothetical protein BKA65DRAFT_549010 [Rhexocercosporidium sp. MPI-PUGE-AT-0058]
MRLLHLESGNLSLTEDYTEYIPPYAILSHTWGKDVEEVTFDDFKAGAYLDKIGYRKVQFCGEQAARDRLQYFWVDTCCIDKSNLPELSEAINSMFRWYQNAVKCYVYLSDVSKRCNADESFSQSTWKSEFRHSRWFTRAWTLQELIAPKSVEFFSQEGVLLGDKGSLELLLYEITRVSVEVLRGKPLIELTVQERMLWAAKRAAKRKEDEAYALLGIFGLHMPMIYGEGRENAFIRLEREIGERSKGANIHGNVHWMIPRALNSLFTGRSDLLDRIQSALQSESISIAQTQRRFVIIGLGGQGKSEICLQIASLLKHKFWGIFWVDVDKPSTAERDFIAVAKLLGHSAKTVHEALQALANTQRSWLLILDNADDPDFDYQVYFPPGNHGAVLMTTRVTECRRYSPDAFEALEGLEEEDSKNLLLKAAEVPRESWSSCGYDAKEVVNLLGSHPLALIQAGAYISQGHCQLGQYPKVYQRQRRRLLKHRPTQAQSRYCDVYATFEASADVLERSQSECASDALRLLEILSMLSSSVLPLQIFEETWKGCKKVSRASDEARGIDECSQDHVSKLPSFMALEEDEWDSFRLTKATFLLASLSLVTRHDLKGYSGLSMHALTHAWAKDRQDLGRQGEVWIISGCVLGLSRLNIRFWQAQERPLLPHVLCYLEIEVKKAFGPGSKPIVTSILLKCAQALLGMRQDTRLGQLLEVVFIELQQNPNKPSEDFLPLYDLQERSLTNLGKNEAAKALLQQILRIRVDVLGKTHPDTLMTMNNLALMLSRQGKYADAEAMNRQTLKIREEVLGKTNPDTLMSMSNLALVLFSQGKYADAEAMNCQTLKIKEEVLGKTHPDTLISMSNLALVLSRQGKYADAEAINRQTLKIREEVLGKTHPVTLMSINNLAGVLDKQGKYADAEAMNRQTLKIREEVLGKTHPDTLISMGNLAGGKYADAEAMNRQTLEISKEVLGKAHPVTLMSMGNLAGVLFSQGKYADAEAMNRQTLEISEEVLGKTHPDTLTSIYCLAHLLQKKEEYEEASILYQRACTGYQLSLGSEHPTTKACINHYSVMLSRLE